MCGIAGFFGKAPKPLSDALIELSKRGRDATGLAFPFKGTVAITKADTAAEEAITLRKFKLALTGASRAPWAIFHCRAATHGSPRDMRNNHPLYTNRCVLVHNGVISTSEEVNTEGQCDSEILGRFIDNMPIDQALTHIKGSVAVAIHLFEEPDTLYLYRDTNPIYIGLSNKTWVFASTEEVCASLGAAVVTSLKPYTLFRLNSQGLVEVEKVGMPEGVFKVDDVVFTDSFGGCIMKLSDGQRLVGTIYDTPLKGDDITFFSDGKTYTFDGETLRREIWTRPSFGVMGSRFPSPRPTNAMVVVPSQRPLSGNAFGTPSS